MGEKLYPEVDHMALGQRYCDHVMAMTAEGLHAKSDIAGQLAWRDDQLAAKDAEIAELRSRIESLVRVKMDGPVIADAALMAGLTQKSIEAMQSNEAAAKALRERDEARECVRIFFPFVREYESMLHNGHEPAESLAELRKVREALAATPEHLRNA